MPNHSKPVIDKENITDEERKRLLNRQKCRDYRNNHREKYREYQRKYKANNVNRPSILHHSWKAEVKRLEQVVEKWAGIHTAVGQKHRRRALKRIADLQQRIAELNYTEINTGTSV